MILIMVLIPIPNLITSTSFFLGLPFSYLQFELLHLPKCYLPINKIINLGQLDFWLRQQYCRGESIYSFEKQHLLSHAVCYWAVFWRLAVERFKSSTVRNADMMWRTDMGKALRLGSLFLCPIGMSTPLVISRVHRLR